MLEVEGDVVSLNGQRNGPVVSGKTLPKFIDERRNDCPRAEGYQKRRPPSRGHKFDL